MNVEDVTPILNVSSLEKSFAWFEQPGWIHCSPQSQSAADNRKPGNRQSSMFSHRMITARSCLNPGISYAARVRASKSVNLSSPIPRIPNP
jgi:hypothetical protein